MCNQQVTIISIPTVHELARLNIKHEFYHEFNEVYAVTNYLTNFC
jgi:hypothetical protein